MKGIESSIEPLLADLHADKQIPCEPACSREPGRERRPGGDWSLPFHRSIVDSIMQGNRP